MRKHFDMRAEVHAARWRAVSLLDRAKHRAIDRSWPANDQIVTASRLKSFMARLVIHTCTYVPT